MQSFISSSPVCVRHHAQKLSTSKCDPRVRLGCRVGPARRCSVRRDTPRSSLDVNVAEASPPLTPGFSQKVRVGDRVLSYDYMEGSVTPTVVFLPGYFFARWRQAKANALEIFAKRKGQAIVVEEYLGTGDSENFARDGTLSHWIADTCALVECIRGPVILVGAGVGGWIMLHVAKQLPERIVGVVGVGPSVDFTHDLIKPSLSEEQMRKIDEDGTVDISWGYCSYPISKQLLDDAKQWLVLNGGRDSLAVTCPVRLLQGLEDEEIPPDRILKLVDVVQSTDCVVSFVKTGDHFLEEEAEMQRMWAAVCDISDNYYEYDLTTPGSG